MAILNFKTSILPSEDNTFSLGSSTKRWQINGNDMLDIMYPVGAVYISVVECNPGQLFGGTWVQIKDKFLLSAGDSYTNGDTGGSSTVTLETANLPSHTHSVGAHAHGLNEHTHSVGAHAHGLNGHTHTGPSHTHTGPSHTHGLNGHTHSGPSHTHGLNGHTHSGPSHTHTRGSMNITGTIGDVMTWARGWCDGAFTKGYANLDRTGAGGDGTGGTRFDFDASRTWSGSTSASGTGSTGGNSGNTTAAGTGATGGNSGNTTAAGTGATGAAGTGATGGPSVANTANSTAFNSGAASGNTANSTAFNSGSTGSGTAHNNMPPYLVVYMYKRTA